MSVTSEQLKEWARQCEGLSQVIGGAQSLRDIAAYLRANIPIPVSERLPEDDDMVLAYNGVDVRNTLHGDDDIYSGWYFAHHDQSRNNWFQGQIGPHAETCDLELISHWLPLPSPPAPNTNTKG